MKQRPTCAARRARQRGSAFVLVIAVTSIVGIIGMAGLMVVRVQHRGVRGRADATQAQALADAALQLIHRRIADDDAWRDDHEHDTWSSAEALGSGTFIYKFVDEDDGDLADDDRDKVRLYTQATVGDSVRLVSVSLQGLGEVGPNLLRNGSIEAGTSPYYTDGSTPTLVIGTGSPYAGENNLRLTQRTSFADAIYQDLTAPLESDQTYRVSGWLRMADTSAQAQIGLAYENTLGVSGTAGTVASVARSWTYVSIDVTPTWTGTLDSARFYYQTAISGQDIELDNAEVRLVYDSRALPVIRGSYRREVQP